MSCSSLQTDFEKIMKFYCTDEEARRRGINFLKKVNQTKFVKLIEDVKRVNIPPKETFKEEKRQVTQEPEKTEPIVTKAV